MYLIKFCSENDFQLVAIYTETNQLLKACYHYEQNAWEILPLDVFYIDCKLSGKHYK